MNTTMYRNATVDLMPVPALAGGILFFACPKKSIEKKRHLLPLNSCASRRELIEGTSVYLDKRDSSLNRP
jgi:hypothetical protein